MELCPKDSLHLLIAKGEGGIIFRRPRFKAPRAILLNPIRVHAEREKLPHHLKSLLRGDRCEFPGLAQAQQ